MGIEGVVSGESSAARVSRNIFSLIPSTFLQQCAEMVRMPRGTPIRDSEVGHGLAQRPIASATAVVNGLSITGRYGGSRLRMMCCAPAAT